MKQPTFPFKVSKDSISVTIGRVEKNGANVFRVLYTLAGQRKQTWRSTFEDAKQAAYNAIEAIKSGDSSGLKLNPTDRHDYLRAVEIAEPLGLTVAEVARECADARALLAGRASVMEVCRDWLKRNSSELPRITVADAAVKLKDQAKADGKSAARQRQFVNVLDRLAQSFNVEVHTITPDLISSYLASLALAERSKRNHRDVIGFFNRWLVLRGHLLKGTDWLENVQNYSARKIGEIEIYSPQEITRLLLVAGGMTPFIAIGAFAGLRHAEIARLDWREVDLDDGFIEVRAANSKTGERRLVPIHDNLKAWLRPYHQTQGKVAPFSSTKEKLGKVAKATASEAIPALEWKHNALRHSYISYRVAETADVPRVSDEAGNSPAIIRQHYLRRVKPAEATAWFAIMPPEKPAALETAEVAK